MNLLPEIFVRQNHEHSRWTYENLCGLQLEIKKKLLLNPQSLGAILLSEVAPVITLGKRAEPELELRATPSEIQARGIQILKTDRGGLATSHGPGQWVLFVVDRLERLTGDPRGVKRAVEGLLRIAYQVARNYDPQAEIRDGCATGVWGSQGKIASVGVQIQDGILLHGLSFNGYRTPTSFFGVRPCGMDDSPVQYAIPADRPEVAFQTLGQQVIQAAKAEFYSTS